MAEYETIRAKQYIKDVASGKLTACRYVRLAVGRHLADLERSKDPSWPYRFDEGKAIRSIKFAQLLKHSKGKWAKRKESLRLEGWQQFIKWCVHGWVRKDTGTRRFRKAYVEVPRKNGKTTLAASDVLDLFFLDGEEGAEIYTAATKRDQAKLCWAEVASMIRKQPALRERVDILNNTSTIRLKGTLSVIKALGADSNTEDGLNPLMGVIDEYHAHKTADMVNVLESGMGSRAEPFIEIITTAGTNQHGPCYQEERTLAVNTLEGGGPEDFFCIIFTLDEGDDWTDPSVWGKANPNLGVSVYEEYLASRVNLALASPRKQNDVKTKNFNIWCSAQTAWIPHDTWDACGGDVDTQALAGRPCTAGLDLANSVDLSAVALVFPPRDMETDYQILVRYYMPEDVVDEKTRTDKVPYALWVEQGWITATPGNIIDQDFIEADLRAVFDLYDCERTAYDPWNASQIVTHLRAEGMTMVPMRQGYATLSPISKSFETLLLSKRIRHGRNPVLAWNMACTSVKEDENGNIRPVKPERGSGMRIDGILATIMALGLALEEVDGTADDGTLWVV
jgi:phage terminase large subunit-like protein